MATVTGTTENEVVSPVLEEKHRETVNWLSAIKLWQKELAFFQTILDGTAHFFTTAEDKKKISRFQNLFMYYHAELLLEFRTRLRNHDNQLANMLSKGTVTEAAYLNEHQPLMAELEQFSKSFTELKSDFYKFLEKIKE